MPRQIDERRRKEVLALDFHEVVPGINGDACLTVDIQKEVDFLGGIVIPVAAAGVLQPCDRKSTGGRTVLRCGRRVEGND